MLVAVVCVTAAFVLSSLSGSAPSWWRPVQANDPATRDAAVAVENALGTELHRVRTTEPWRVALRAEDATAWLNTRLNEWLISQGPSAPNRSNSGTAPGGSSEALSGSEVFRLPAGMDELQVQFEGDRVYIGVRLVGADRARPRFLSASLVPRLDDDGSLWLPAEWVHIGRMPIPASWALSRADQERDVLLPEGWQQSAEADTFFAVLAGTVPVPRPARVELADGRVVRAVAVRTNDSRLAITFVTE